MNKADNAPLLSVNRETKLDGLVERVIFHNPDNAFSVLVVQPDSPSKNSGTDTINCVGKLVAPRPGMRLHIEGHFINNPRFGRQLAFELAEELIPESGEALASYLASGLIKGIGEKVAKRIVDAFGSETVRILDDEPEKLLSISGIGKKSLAAIRESWDKHRHMKDLLVFLRPHGIGTGTALRIYKAYGDEALATVRQNPYRLAMDVQGIGFLTADAIASKLGFAEDHPLRVEAAALYTLHMATEDGHVFLPEDELVEKICRQINIGPEQATAALDALERDERIVRENMRDSSGREFSGIYLARYHHCESKTAFYLKRILNSPKAVRFTDMKTAFADALQNMPIELAEEQKKAVLASMRSKILVITGGPGTGKTTIIKALIKVFEESKGKIMLAAPTGRAAKRMAEACGREAKTIHRLLEYSPREERFCRDEDNPLACGLLVVDEASMMDTLIFYYLLKAVPLGATLVFVGDVHQLPSVGPGNVLDDLIESGVVDVVRLTEIFRQSAESAIICNAHQINHGIVPPLEWNTDKSSDFYFVPRDDPEEAAELVVDLIKNRIPRRFGLDPVNDIQLLTPMRKGAVGTERMNAMLQAALNPNAYELRRGDRIFRQHDKVMQVRNNYDKDIFNGDIGRIEFIDKNKRQLLVNFDGVSITYENEELDELVPAYAISIHKSQGSEYPAVVIPLMMQHYVLLRRNLVYTGITRGKKLVILVGEKKALHVAVQKNNTGKRHTWLAARLASGAPRRSLA